ncbi:hypothetical protein [uncultured Alistipes sp.]|jgi:hypothetical protein|uniref:hypothetical protein n=1 Tax=uncultured Alistipes sp. TaxID=538949 RepID=UPI0025E23091|nr:hypothetical protein [uncultured Alistipes sp.]
MEDKKLDAAESFALISRMIENTRSRMVRNSGRPFLIWGYTTVAVTIAVWLAVWRTQNPQWNILWGALPLLGALLMWLTRDKQAEGRVYTFVDRVINKIWLVIGLSAWFVGMLAMFGATRIPILFIILLLMGIGTTLTCLIIRFTPGVAGGIVGIALAPVMLLVTGGWVPGLFIAGFAAMMIVPGHILNYKSNHPNE